MTLFGFTQLEFPGSLALADGRYVLREKGKERVMVLETHGAPPPPRRRRRKPRATQAAAEPESLPLARVTLVRAFEPFEGEGEAAEWLERVADDDEGIDALVAETLTATNKALHTHAVASADPLPQTLSASQVTAARIGFGNGDQVASGDFAAAREVDARTGTSSRQRRAEELRPQERVAAVLGDREQLDACETLLLRARADLDAGRSRESALQLRVGLEALLAELQDAVADPGHTEDMAELSSRRQEAGDLANAALQDPLSPPQSEILTGLLDLCERVLRRRRVLRG